MLVAWPIAYRQTRKRNDLLLRRGTGEFDLNLSRLLSGDKRSTSWSKLPCNSLPAQVGGLAEALAKSFGLWEFVLADF